MTGRFGSRMALFLIVLVGAVVGVAGGFGLVLSRDALPGGNQSGYFGDDPDKVAVSWFGEGVSDCSEATLVFAMSADRENHKAHLDLPPGIYFSVLIADGDITLGRLNRSSWARDRSPSKPYTYVRSWNDWKGDPLAMDRQTMRVDGSVVTIWSAHVQTPGGIVQFGISFLGYPEDHDEWHQSRRWRWEIYRPSICEPPVGEPSGWSSRLLVN